MEDGLFTKQGKKLLMIGIFLWFVAALVGREEDPGVIANLAEDGATPKTAISAPMPVAAAPSASVVRRPAPAPRREDPNLSSWYAESDGAGAVDPQPVTPVPVDNSHLINNAKPIGVAQPVG